MASQVPPELLELIAAAARDTGVEVYHTEISGRELRVQVESQSGASVRACSEFSHALTTRLDAADFLHRQYTLEVSTPGIERRLYRPQDYVKAVNRHVKLLVRDGWVEGLLEAAGPDTIRLGISRGQKSEGRMQKAECRTSPCENEAPREIAYTEIREAHIRVPDCELFASSAGRGQGSRESSNQETHSNPRILDPLNPVERK